jgi:hypothetical protein
MLALEPGAVSADAVRLIARHERTHDRLPDAVREWYLVPNVVPLRRHPNRAPVEQLPGTRWYQWSDGDYLAFLADVLDDFAATADPGWPLQFVGVAVSRDELTTWWVDPHGGDDPPVWATSATVEPAVRTLVAGTFSGFMLTWIAGHHAARHPPGIEPAWLAAPAAPVPLPVFDFLADRLGQPTEIAGTHGVNQYRYRGPDGEVRITADDFSHPTPHAAWWLSSPTADGLAQLRELLAPWDALGPEVLTSADDHAGRLRSLRGSVP